MYKSNALLTLCLLSSGLLAQANTVPGLDGRLYSISSLSRMGTTATQVGYSARNDMCNVGTVNIPWNAPMAENHPMFGFLLMREHNGRFEQISDRSFCKHAFLTINITTQCGNCGPGSGSSMGLGCADIYGVSNNADRNYLGPADEIDPWLNTWTAQGSYFDQGFPNVGSPGNNNGQRSTISPTSSVMNRITVDKSDIVAGANYYYAFILMHRGESLANRGDNLMWRGTNLNPSTWASSDAGAPTQGCVLNAWSGATVGSGSNGTENGTFYVAGRSTETSPGNYRYEYAMQNVDNNRGAASLRIPICPTATASNFTFRDIDNDPLNDWTGSRVGNEIVFSAPAGNALDWNMIYNFGFDCDATGGAGDVQVDQARPGTGALSLTVTGTLAPNGAPVQTASTSLVGTGCGIAGFSNNLTTDLSAIGVPTSPNPNFFLRSTTAPSALYFISGSFGTATPPVPLGPGCLQYIDSNAMFTIGFYLANPAGSNFCSLIIPQGIEGFEVNLQLAQFYPNGVMPNGQPAPALGALGVSNMLTLTNSISGGCP